MITSQQAQYLLDLPKHIIEDDSYIDRKSLSPNLPIDERIYMASKSDTDFTFFLDIWQSTKQQIKLTLHFQEEDSSIALLRVDFNGRHQNPQTLNANVPNIFHPYVGIMLETSHIHYFVESYKPLAWAIPLEIDDSFAVKEFSDTSQVGSIIQAFARKINLRTQLMITIQTSIQ
ncbi:MAG: hypothetical protein U0T79_09455 [Ferruginibacter sp.]